MTTANPYQAPKAKLLDASNAPKGRKLTLQEILFSFEGRLSRKPFWLQGVLTLGVVLFVVAFVEAMLMQTAWLTLAAQLLIVYPSIALQVKRWHDRDKSGWWFFIGFIPVIGTIWALVENGLLRGTEGPNRYGADSTDLY